MEGLCLLVAHLVGDFIFQNDRQSKYKSSPHPGLYPQWSKWAPDPQLYPDEFQAWLITRNDRAMKEAWEGWEQRRASWVTGHLACTVHCFLYTAAFGLFCGWFLPWWAYPVLFAAHWPVDRFRLARRLMTVTGQEEFATGPLSPWSTIVVDQTLHLVVTVLVGLLALKGVPLWLTTSG